MRTIDCKSDQSTEKNGHTTLHMYDCSVAHMHILQCINALHAYIACTYTMQGPGHPGGEGGGGGHLEHVHPPGPEWTFSYLRILQSFHHSLSH